MKTNSDPASKSRQSSKLAPAGRHLNNEPAGQARESSRQPKAASRKHKKVKVQKNLPSRP